jgi:hypothetical protein
VAEGKGSGAHTSIAFAPTRAKFVRITQTDTTENAPNWAVANLRLFEAGSVKQRSVAVSSQKTRSSVSSTGDQ